MPTKQNDPDTEIIFLMYACMGIFLTASYAGLIAATIGFLISTDPGTGFTIGFLAGLVGGALHFRRYVTFFKQLYRIFLEFVERHF